MGSKLPSTTIDAADVMEFCTTRNQHPTLEHCEKWLRLHKRAIEDLMREVIEEEMEKILDEVTMHGYPDPVFDAMYRRLDDAILAATEAHAEATGTEFNASSHTEAEMLKVVEQMIDQGHLDTDFDYELKFSPAGSDPLHAEIVEQIDQIHIGYASGQIDVQLLSSDTEA